MAFFNLKKMFSFGRKGEQEQIGTSDEDFAVLHNRFRMFLTAWNRFQEVETQLEYTLCCDHPFGIWRVQELCTDVALQVFQCIRQLRALNPKPCDELLARFSTLQKEVSSFVYEGTFCPAGPMIVSLDSPELQSGKMLAAPSIFRLGALPEEFLPLVPPGFVITGSGCQKVLGQPKLAEEIARRIQAAGGVEPDTLWPLCDGIAKLLSESPLPQDLTEELIGALASLRSACTELGLKKPRLLLMGRLWPLESDGETDGLIIWGPSLPLAASDEEIFAALKESLARKISPQAMVYRRARGLTEATTGVCIVCLAVEEGSIGGVAHTANPLQPTGSFVHVFACHGLPEDMEYSSRPVDVFYVAPKAPWHVRAHRLHEGGSQAIMPDSIAAKIAEVSIRIAELQQRPQSVIWTVDEQGALKLLFMHDLRVRSLVQERPTKRDLLGLRVSLATPVQATTYKESPLGKERSLDEDSYIPEEEEGADSLPLPLLTGGTPANPGIAAGRAVVVRTWKDVCTLPPHAVVVTTTDDYQWAALIDRVAAFVVEGGRPGSRLSSLCREFGIPAVFGMKDATKVMADQEWVTVSAGNGCVYPGVQNALAGKASPPIDYMPGSPVYRVLERAALQILPLTMDLDSVDFRADNCKTYHDIARYCHAKAIEAMFSLGSGKTQARERVRQLFDGVVKQFWVINLSDGFASAPKGPVIDIADITSVPMQALWHGMNIFPWEGPPPVDGKGFLSVLFEATANPNLDPATQSNYFSERNYFLVSKQYVSMYSRFGFHLVTVEARLGSRKAENYVIFSLRGGAADIGRRVLRVNFVGDILWEFGFHPEIHADALSARLEGMSIEEGQALLNVAGYLAIHTRQLDMIMQDREQIALRREEMLSRCRQLYTGIK